MIDVCGADIDIRRDQVAVAAERRNADASRFQDRSPLRGGRRVLDALLEQRSVELGELESEASERLAELLPLALPEVARERPDTWPRRLIVQAREHATDEAHIARDEWRRSRRRLEREPTVVSDLGKRASAFREVDSAGSRTAVARNDPRVLDVNSPDQRAESPDLRGNVEAALSKRVREVEVASECVRSHAGGKREDLLGGECPLVAERDTPLGGDRAERAERPRRTVDVSFALQLRAHEERNEDDLGSELIRPRDRVTDVVPGGAGTSAFSSASPPLSLCSPSTRACISSPVVCFARRSDSRRVSFESRRSTRPAVISTPAHPICFARAKTSASSRPPITVSITAALMGSSRSRSRRSRSGRASRPPRPIGRPRASARARAGCAAPSCRARVLPR